MGGGDFRCPHHQTRGAHPCRGQVRVRGKFEKRAAWGAARRVATRGVLPGTSPQGASPRLLAGYGCCAATESSREALPFGRKAVQPGQKEEDDDGAGTEGNGARRP